MASTGIEVRHQRTCRSTGGGRCNCQPTWRARVWDGREGRRVRKAFASKAAAETWYRDAKIAVRQGALAVPSSVTVREAADEWLAGARAGTIRNRGGTVYRPSALRGYERALRLRVLPRLGGTRLSELRRRDVQAFADEMLAAGVNPATVVKTLDPLRAICRRAVRRDELTINPTADLELPRANGRRERVAPPEEATRLIGATPEGDRALWATAFYRSHHHRNQALPHWLSHYNEHRPHSSIGALPPISRVHNLRGHDS